MKKCPTCDREFPDSMRFCQTDGTALVEAVQPEDPYKTTVGRREDILDAIPPADPFATVVGGGSNSSTAAPKKEDADDLLQLPQELDAGKTQIVTPGELQDIKADAPQDDVIDLPPVGAASPLDAFSSSVVSPPAPPKFNEPSVAAPPAFSEKTTSFSGGLDNKTFQMNSDSEIAEAISSLPPKIETAKGDSLFAKDAPEPAAFNNEPSSFDAPSDSPFNKPTGPIPSPFDKAKPTSFDPPSTPLPTYKEPEPVALEKDNPFAPPSPFGQPAPGPLDKPAAAAQQQQNQQSNWTPPPAPEANWQNQPVGQNTPFQPPPAGGKNQTMAIISLVLGILSIACCGWFVPGIVAVILGFVAKGKADQNPQQYGGRGLALGGIITGGVSVVLGIIVVILYFMGTFASLLAQ